MKVFFKENGNLIEVKDIKSFFTERGYKNKYYEGAFDWGRWYKGKKYPQFAGLDFKGTETEVIYSPEKPKVKIRKSKKPKVRKPKTLSIIFREVIATKIIESEIKYNEIKGFMEDRGINEKIVQKTYEHYQWKEGVRYPRFDQIAGPILEGNKIIYISKKDYHKLSMRKYSMNDAVKERRRLSREEKTKISPWRKSLKFS